MQKKKKLHLQQVILKAKEHQALEVKLVQHKKELLYLQIKDMVGVSLEFIKGQVSPYLQQVQS